MTRCFKIVSIISIALLVGLQFSWVAASLTVSTGKSIYEYGDFLSITFEVSQLTGEPAVIHIVDETGQTSSPIPIQLSKLNSTIIAPVPFYKTNYSPGIYHIDVEYSGTKTSISYKLVDSGRIAIPSQYKELMKSWARGSPPDKNLANVILELVHFDIIRVPGYDSQTIHAVHIPAWFKSDVKWWSDDSITDNELGLAIQYLMKTGIISV